MITKKFDANSLAIKEEKGGIEANRIPNRIRISDGE